ncbi:MAG: hypothetical protein KDA75_04020 [Planctomycetaceae bacterium]|nr:hypothetical protein [Planctomycetaceae bacterium]
MPPRGVIPTPEEMRRIQSAVEAHERLPRRTLPPLRKRRVLSGASVSTTGPNVTECGCGSRQSQLLGVDANCSAIADGYNAAGAYTWKMPYLAHPGTTDLSEATITVRKSFDASEECIWKETATHDLTCVLGGEEDTEAGYFKLTLYGRTLGGETLHPEALIVWVTDDAGSAGISCDYQAVAHCREFDPMEGGMFTWQPGNCIQVEGCFCVNAATAGNICNDCEQPATVSVSFPTFTTPGTTPATFGSEWLASFPGSAFSGKTLTIGCEVQPSPGATTTSGPCNNGGVGIGGTAGPITTGPDYACTWSCVADVYSRSDLYSAGSPCANLYVNYPTNMPSCGSGPIPFKTSDDCNIWVTRSVSTTVRLYKRSDAATHDPSYAFGSENGWCVAVVWSWLAIRFVGGVSETTYGYGGFWGANTGIPETQVCVDGTFSLNAIAGGAPEFDDTTVVVTLDNVTQNTDLNLDGVPEYQPCIGDASDDNCGTWEWVECSADEGLTCEWDGTTWTLEGASAATDCATCSCDGLSPPSGSDPTSAEPTCSNGVGYWTPLAGADATSTQPARNGAYDGEVVAGVCL